MISNPNKGCFQIIPITTDDRDFVTPFFEQLYKNTRNYVDFDALVKHELGIHRIQYLPNTETRGRTHTATVLIDYNFAISNNNYSYKKCFKVRAYNLVQRYVHDYQLNKIYNDLEFDNIIKGNLTCVYDKYKLLI